MKLQKTLLLLSFISLCIASCKKDNPGATKPACKIITMSGASTQTINISYNADEKIASISQGNDNQIFQYSGNSIIVNKTNQGAFASKEIITINANGDPENIRTEYNVSGTNWTNDVFEYSGRELIKQTQTSSSTSTSTVQIIIWSAGNATSIQTIGSSDSTTLEYYTDKPNIEGDYLDYLFIPNSGIRHLRNKNLFKSMKTGSTIISATYSFGTDGKINGLTETVGGASKNITYQYQCN
ncbi:MAG: hypothetical protein HYZ15_07490 [Sphingobacteriales bacterium]|nr:hypothetical protein [Sphingobacteriales bacterium]